MRILVTGSSGQIGTNLALRCVERGHEVTGVDCRANGWTNAFRCELRDLEKPVGGMDPAADFAGFGQERPDIVVHLAAHAKVHELVQDPRRALANVSMAHLVLEYCRRLSVPIVFASSREVYGDLHCSSARESDADFSGAASAYAAGKIAVESMVYAYSRCYGLPYLVFRLSNVYGRFDNDLDRMERVVPLFIRRIADDQSITVFGAGKVLDFTHVDDCIDGIVSGIERLGDGRVRNQTINLASGEGHSLLQLAAWVGDCLGKQPRIVLAQPQAGEVIRYVANLEKARALLDFAPKIALRDGVSRAVAWGQALAHPAPRRAPDRPGIIGR
ncbi:MAG: NAD-dependent epimerase/dehydratase family protein [Betaproteobacteria bacterium]|nr:NAD-dependent epimerase/dehydratase family protein [Betaproteobacteria bacterium]